jgi:hypothetical protein
MTKFDIFDDDRIESAIEEHDDPEHGDALTVTAARGILAEIQQSIENHYDEWLDLVDRGKVEVVHEDEEVIVFADHGMYNWREELDGAAVEDPIHRRVIKSIHLNAASDLADYSWSTSDPLVFEKPTGD